MQTNLHGTYNNSASTMASSDINYMSGWDGYALADEPKIEWNDAIHNWDLLKIKRYLISLKSKKLAEAYAKRMSGIWTQMALLGLTADYVKENDGSIAWTVKNGMSEMLEYLKRFIEHYYEAIETIEESKKEIARLENQQCNHSNGYEEWEEIAHVGLDGVQTAFEELDIRNNVDKLQCLSDRAYNKFCMKIAVSNVAEAVALFHIIELEKYAENAKTKESAKKTLLFESLAEMHKFVHKAIGQSNEAKIKKEFSALGHTNSAATVNQCSSYKYLDSSKEFYNSLL